MLYRADLANSYRSLGYVQRATGNADAALNSYWKAIEIRKKLTEDHPSVVDYRAGLAKDYGGFGLSQSAIGEMDDALDSVQKAIEIQEELRESRSSRFHVSP